MASIKEVEDWISKRIYPHVARTSDPLIVRVSRFSLLVNDTNFYAKIKNGLGYKGYLIYSSGLGTPILEESATNETEFFSNDAFKKAVSDNGTDTGNKFYESAKRVLTVLQDAAQSWLDTIELEIAKQPNDNAIKKAIDRLCWQLHYDITESSTDFVDNFKDNDFGDVEIDWKVNDTSWDGKTVNKSIEDNYTAISTSVTDGSSTIKGGISSFDGNLCGKFETFDSHFTTFDTKLNGSLNTIGTKLVPDGNYYSISECLRDKNDSSYKGKTTYSIARSLRESKTGSMQESVSQATHDQTELEATRFTKIDNNIGDCNINSDPNTEPVYLPLSERIGKTGDSVDSNVSVVKRIGVFGVTSGDGTFRSLFDTISGSNGYANPHTNSLYNAVGYGSGTGLEGRLGVTSTNTRSIAERLGYNSSGSVESSFGSVESSIGSVESSIGSPRKKDGTTGTESLFDAVYRHAGLLNVAGEGWDGYIDTHANSAVSNILNAINA